MPSFEQLKAYLQNPGVAADELKHRWEGARKDVMDNASQQQANNLNKLVPGMTTPEKEGEKLTGMEGLANAAGMANVAKSTLAPASRLATSLENAPLSAAEDAGQLMKQPVDRSGMFKKLQETLDQNPTSEIAAANKERALTARGEAPGATMRAQEPTLINSSPGITQSNPELLMDMLKRTGVR